VAGKSHRSFRTRIWPHAIRAKAKLSSTRQVRRSSSNDCLHACRRICRCVRDIAANVMFGREIFRRHPTLGQEAGGGAPEHSSGEFPPSRSFPAHYRSQLFTGGHADSACAERARRAGDTHSAPWIDDGALFYGVECRRSNVLPARLEADASTGREDGVRHHPRRARGVGAVRFASVMYSCSTFHNHLY